MFPTDCYNDKQYGLVEIHQLQGAKKDDDGTVAVIHPEAFLVTQWLEKGVFDAMEEGYLKSLIFAIYTRNPKDGSDLLLETYEFRVTYPEEGKSAKVNDVELYSKEAVKSQAAKFIRSLTEFTSTLDNLPSERKITMQLKVTKINFYSGS